MPDRSSGIEYIDCSIRKGNPDIPDVPALNYSIGTDGLSSPTGGKMKTNADYCRDWRKRHPERAKQSKQRWREKNPDKVKELNHRAYERRKARKGEGAGSGEQ